MAGAPNATSTVINEMDENLSIPTNGEKESSKCLFKRQPSSFMRAGDLGIDSCHSCASDEMEQAGFQEAEELDAGEVWIAVDGECSREVMPHVLDAMVHLGLRAVNDTSMWTPGDRKTAAWTKELGDQPTFVEKTDILLWTGNFRHGGYGSDIPCVKSMGLVDMSPRDLALLLIDSSRVRSYNKISQGRTDEVLLQSGIDSVGGTFGKGETKIIRSLNKPPLVPTALEFLSILHARKLDPEEGEGNGYIAVGRSVSRSSNVMEKSTTNANNEILLNVHIMKAIEGFENKTVMININHFKSALVPTFIAKQMGLSSASNFITDIRDLAVIPDTL
mmetsp:Transcript_11385/g.15771  ORF Transcript_11385/g.15771 Transcript_11385/m.15771 type:complete len:333 (-) Transcript_11385:76-1074(-)